MPAKLPILCVSLAFAFATTFSSASQAAPRPACTETGIASFYGPGFHGKPTASGEIFDSRAMTAAHPSLPLGTEVTVTRLATGASVEVTINDRGPYIDGRIIDLSVAAAEALDMIEIGIDPVIVTVHIADQTDPELRALFVAHKVEPAAGSEPCPAATVVASAG